MPRLVRHELTGPVRIDPQDTPVFICGCGLTQNFPHCDGSHKVCKAEHDDTLYVYDKDRTSVIDTRKDT